MNPAETCDQGSEEVESSHPLFSGEHYRQCPSLPTGEEKHTINTGLLMGGLEAKILKQKPDIWQNAACASAIYAL